MEAVSSYVKSDFDFGWKKWNTAPIYAELAFKHQKGDILDIGCATCQIYEFLKEKSWKGKYYGIDVNKYEAYEYPDDVNLMIGNAMELEFPNVDTVILYNILEHIKDPVALLKKTLKSSRNNVLIYVPQRNEELWKNGTVEYHQLDKTHKHCGFSKEDVYNMVNLAGGKITIYKNIGEIDATMGVNLWNSTIPRLIITRLFKRIFSSKSYYQEIWAEVVRI